MKRSSEDVCTTQKLPRKSEVGKRKSPAATSTGMRKRFTERRPGNSSSPEMADRQVSTQNALTVAGSAEAASNRSHTKMRVNGLKDT